MVGGDDGGFWEGVYLSLEERPVDDGRGELILAVGAGTQEYRS